MRGLHIHTQCDRPSRLLAWKQMRVCPKMLNYSFKQGHSVTDAKHHTQFSSTEEGRTNPVHCHREGHQEGALHPKKTKQKKVQKAFFLKFSTCLTEESFVTRFQNYLPVLCSGNPSQKKKKRKTLSQI